jgi:predicted DNA-binding transcriptional regulator YafY
MIFAWQHNAESDIMLSKGKNYNRKIFRLIYILNKLDSGVDVCTKDLARKFNVSMRTIQRDLELLNMTGFPITSSERGYSSFAGNFSLKKIMLPEEEASLLSFMYEIAQLLGKSFEGSFRAILRKVLTKSSETPYYIKFPKGIKIGDDKSHNLKELEHAIEECRKTEICYSGGGAEKTKLIHPLKIVYFDGFWYLLSRQDKEGTIRVYRIDKIKRVKVLGSQFKIYENLRALLDESTSAWLAAKRDKKVIVEVDKEVAGYFKQKEYFPLQKIVNEGKDGSLTIEARVGQFMEVIPTIMSWAPYIKVIEPEDLKEEIKHIITTYAARS